MLYIVLFAATVRYAGAYWSWGGDMDGSSNCIWDEGGAYGRYSSDDEGTASWYGGNDYYAVVSVFELERSGGICYDYVQIWYADYIANGDYCGLLGDGYSLPSQFRLNNQLTVNIIADGSTEWAGFEICAYRIKNCAVTLWSAWSECSVSCGGGSRTRNRDVVQQAGPYGDPCMENVGLDSEVCGTIECPVDCVYTEWSDYGACTEECGGGVQFRARQIASDAQHNGVECEQSLLSDLRACNEHDCPVNCELSSWSPWSECSASCAGGFQTKTREIVQDVVGTGDACGNLQAEQICNEQPCPIDCRTSEWSAYGECSVSCGGGTQVSEKIIFTNPEHGGAACGELSRSQACGETPCPVDCVLSDFGAWSECTATCGGGTQFKERSIEAEAQHGGACEELRMEKACNSQHCPCDYVTNAPAPGHEGCCPLRNLIWEFDLSPEASHVKITGCCEKETPFGVCETCQYVENVKAIKVKGAGKAKKLSLTADSNDLEGAACECSSLCAAEEDAAFWLMNFSWKKLNKLNCSCYSGANAKINKVTAADDNASGYAGGATDAHHAKLLAKAS